MSGSANPPRELRVFLQQARRRPLRAHGRGPNRRRGASPPHLSLAPVHRRGWCSLYAALKRGKVDDEALRDLLVRHLPGNVAPPIFAVDVSVGPRCDAEASPGRGYYYHTSRHSAGEPIVAGWAYQLVAGLGSERDSWVIGVYAWVLLGTTI